MGRLPLVSRWWWGPSLSPLGKAETNGTERSIRLHFNKKKRVKVWPPPSAESQEYGTLCAKKKENVVAASSFIGSRGDIQAQQFCVRSGAALHLHNSDVIIVTSSS